jgi:hypothetical protein
LVIEKNNEIESLKLLIAKLQRMQFGPSSNIHALKSCLPEELRLYFKGFIYACELGADLFDRGIRVNRDHPNSRSFEQLRTVMSALEGPRARKVLCRPGYVTCDWRSTSALKGRAICFNLSFRFEPVLDIVAVYPSSSKEQFVCSLRNVIFSYCTAIFCSY